MCTPGLSRNPDMWLSRHPTSWKQYILVGEAPALNEIELPGNFWTKYRVGLCIWLKMSSSQPTTVFQFFWFEKLGVSLHTFVRGNMIVSRHETENRVQVMCEGKSHWFPALFISQSPAENFRSIAPSFIVKTANLWTDSATRTYILYGTLDLARFTVSCARFSPVWIGLGGVFFRPKISFAVGRIQRLGRETWLPGITSEALWSVRIMAPWECNWCCSRAMLHWFAGHLFWL